jgi:uncharacterized membrane protein
MEIPTAAYTNKSKTLTLLVLFLGILVFVWWMNTPEGLLGKADAIGYAVCHQIDLRSFHLGERRLPLCARCSGMYLGAILGLSYQWFIGRRRAGTPPWTVLALLGVFVFAFIVDGLNSFVSLIPGISPLYPPGNTTRLITGTGMGLVIAAALYPAFNATVWKGPDPLPALKNLIVFFGLIALAIGLDLLVLTEEPIILYPLALISAAGVIGLLTMVYSMVWIMVFRAENRYNHFKEMLIPLVGGLTVAFLQIGLLDLLRYGLTGTWEGFHLG